MLFQDDYFDNKSNLFNNSFLCGDTINNPHIDKMSLVDSIIDNLCTSPIEPCSNKNANDNEWESPTLFDCNNSVSSEFNCASKCNTPLRSMSKSCCTLNILEMNACTNSTDTDSTKTLSNTSEHTEVNDDKIQTTPVVMSVPENVESKNSSRQGNVENGFINTTLNNIINDNLQQEDDVNRVVPENYDIPSLYKYVNELYSETLSNKKKYEDLAKKVFEVSNCVDKMTQDFLDFKCNISGRVLGNELKVENIEKKDIKLTSVHQKIETNKNRINNITNFENACNRYDENIKEINKKIKKYQQDLEIFKEDSQHFIKPTENEVKPLHQPLENKGGDYSNTTFNHDVILLVDSNLVKIRPDIMDAGKTCAKFFCPTLAHIDFLMKSVEIKKQPQIVFIHCGTNHLSERYQLTRFLEDDFIDSISNLRKMLPNAKFIISSLLPRMEPCLKIPVRYINDFLYGVCSAAQGLSFMRNINIKAEMLIDNKHINSEGFKTMLSNIRFKIFNKMPYI